MDADKIMDIYEHLWVYKIAIETDYFPTNIPLYVFDLG